MNYVGIWIETYRPQIPADYDGDRIEGNEIRVLLITEKGTAFLRFPGVLFRGI